MITRIMTTQNVLGVCAGVGLVAGGVKLTLDQMQEIKSVFEGKPEMPSEATVDLTQKVTLVSKEAQNQIAAVSVNTKESASAAPENNQGANKIGSSSTWMSTLDWAAIAKATSVAIGIIGLVGAAVMYVMGSKK